MLYRVGYTFAFLCMMRANIPPANDSSVDSSVPMTPTVRPDTGDVVVDMDALRGAQVVQYVQIVESSGRFELIVGTTVLALAFTFFICGMLVLLGLWKI
jgi:hypothetical protein